MKLVFIYILFVVLFQSVSSQYGTVGTASTVQESQEEQLAKPFVMKGWLKFFTFAPLTFYNSPLPNKFEYNPAWQAQYSWGRTPSFGDKDKDLWDFHIP